MIEASKSSLFSKTSTAAANYTPENTSILGGNAGRSGGNNALFRNSNGGGSSEFNDTFGNATDKMFGEVTQNFSYSLDRETGNGGSEQEIDEWVAQNANSKESFLFIDYDDDGGERVSRALSGDSSLGSLTASEQRHLIDAAVKEWRQTGNIENIREAAENLTSSETKQIVVEAYADASAADERFFAEGGFIFTTEEADAAKFEMLQTAIQLDPVTVVDSFAGVEGDLGKLASNMSPAYQNKLVEAVASGKVDPTNDGVSQMVTAIFLKSDAAGFVLSNDFRENMSGALAQVMVNRNGLSDTAIENNIDELQQRFDDILASPGGAELLLDDKVAPELRCWAATEIAANPNLDAEALKAGWDSEKISSAYAAPIIQRYQGRGVEPQTLGGEALRNTIGQALGIMPDQLPGAEESTAHAETRLEAGMDYPYYGQNKRINDIANKIKELGGDNAQVSIMPVTVTNNEFGAATFNVFKVQGEDGKTYFVEDVDPSHHYTGFDDWHANSNLPPGEMTYVSGMEWGPAGNDPELTTENTPQVTDTLGEWALEIGDKAALGAGIVAGAVAIFGTAGLGTFAVAGAAGAYTTARAGGNLYDAHAHGVDITDLSNPEVRADWMDAAAGTLSLGAMGAAKFASAASKVAAGLQMAADTADAAAAINQANDLRANWGEMDNGQRAMGLLNIAFWGGMTAASARAGGGQLTDAYSFTRLKNNLEFGSPYEVSSNSDMQTGEMRIVYDTGENGRAANIRIEHGGDTPDPGMLDLHSRTARQMESSGNLLDRIGGYFTGGDTAEVGSAAWEAQFELNKINAEAQSIGNSLTDPNLSSPERASLESRLSELEAATAYQTDRLNQLEQLGEGWVAKAHQGAEQAEKLGWPEAPDGYTWVAGPAEPHLRRLDTDNSEPLYYDKITGTFAEDAEKPRNVRTGHGENEVAWEMNATGQPIEVSATLREFYTNAERSYAEVKAQGQVGSAGRRAGDEGGHVIGHRFVQDQGLQNMFPQDANLNRGAYKALENEMADWIAAGCDVNVNIQLKNYQNGRPAEIEVSFQVVDPISGNQVEKRDRAFKNETNQTYNRVEKSDMESMIVAARKEDKKI
jgi:hypothetical protein